MGKMTPFGPSKFNDGDLVDYRGDGNDDYAGSRGQVVRAGFVNSIVRFFQRLSPDHDSEYYWAQNEFLDRVDD